ncbi:SMI1/KNR4 family protein [Labedella populi]|uniref:SMI1/KNR4 family protein n=1 Tax=Labedella populi TaxID=2498850 RepID=A0A3S4AXU3_9MICO|nr:SMI1/KNR4 family protein [Labedella populi]RWZ58433.1 SMI1/KNR4 family protein [Labedella populi]
MAYDDVSALLEQYEQLARARGSVAIDYLRPGLTVAEITEIEERYGFPLSDDVKAVWMWHNGMGPRPSRDTPVTIGSGWDFRELSESIEYAQMILDMRNEGDGDRYVESRWVTFNRGSRSDVIETSNIQLPDSSVLLSDMTSSVLNFPIVTVAEKIRWYIWAIENGVWFVDDTGTWRSRHELYPKNGMRHLI